LKHPNALHFDLTATTLCGVWQEQLVIIILMVISILCFVKNMYRQQRL